MIVIYGATGTTGALVAEELVGRGFEVVLSGRDRDRLRAWPSELAGLEIRPAQVHDRGRARPRRCAARAWWWRAPGRSCRSASRSCAPPSTPAPTTSTSPASRPSCATPTSATTRRRGRPASSPAPGFALEVALGDWAASRAAAAGAARRPTPTRSTPVDELMIGYALSHVSASAGTRQSLIGALSQPASVWREDRWERGGAAVARRARIAFPAAVRRARGVRCGRRAR